MKKAGGKGKERNSYYFFLMEKKAELEKACKLGNKSHDSLSREMFPIWEVSDLRNLYCRLFNDISVHRLKLLV